MKTLTIILLIAASSLLSAQTPAPTRTYSGGINGPPYGPCTRVGHGAVIKSSPGTILTIHAGGGAVSLGFYLMLFNKTTAPMPGDVPAIVIPFISPTHDIGYYFGSADRDYPGGLPMTTGISWALSNSPTALATVCSSMTLTVTYQ